MRIPRNRKDAIHFIRNGAVFCGTPLDSDSFQRADRSETFDLLHRELDDFSIRLCAQCAKLATFELRNHPGKWQWTPPVLPGFPAATVGAK